jgi:hypothetical protein
MKIPCQTNTAKQVARLRPGIGRYCRLLKASTDLYPLTADSQGNVPGYVCTDYHDDGAL